MGVAQDTAKVNNQFFDERSGPASPQDREKWNPTDAELRAKFEEEKKGKAPVTYVTAKAGQGPEGKVTITIPLDGPNTEIRGRITMLLAELLRNEGRNVEADEVYMTLLPDEKNDPRRVEKGSFMSQRDLVEAAAPFSGFGTVGTKSTAPEAAVEAGKPAPPPAGQPLKTAEASSAVKPK